MKLLFVYVLQGEVGEDAGILLTRTFTLPSCSSVSLKKRSICSGEVTVPCTRMAFAPVALIFSTTRRAPSRSEAWFTATAAPSFASDNAMPAPIPFDAPVTNAILPSSFPIHQSPCFDRLVSDMVSSLWPVSDLSKLNAFAHGQRTLQGKARNLIFTHECDARMGLRIDDELFEHLSARRAAGDAIVRANGHHPTTCSRLGIERIKFRLEIVSIHCRAEVPDFVVHNVIHVECVGHNGKWFVVHVNHEGLVAADVVNVVDEAERLKNLQGMRSAAQPESIEADWPRAGCSLDAFNALLI